ncbi:MAG: Crp/Fnr family transcriptional regulator [Bacteroidetes bacterium]|nr:Crp/Fnr family transcriptional regulator [Bacteroidota bacterium]
MTINPNNNINYSLDNYKELIQTLKSIGQTLKIAKGKCILTEGDVVNHIFIIEKGCFRTFRWIDDEEVTIGFSFEGDIDTCPYAFINQLKSTDCIEALTDSQVIKIPRSELQNLERQKPELNKFTQMLLSHYIEILIQRNIDLRIKSAEQLYQELHKRQPKEVAQIPLMYIASYLGISKERLSRIRKNFKPID